MFNNKQISKRIWKAVKDKIETAQLKYDDGVAVLEEKLVQDKINLEEKIVSEFLNKII